MCKRHAGPIARALARPWVLLGRFLLRAIGVPAYRIWFFVRRHTFSVYAPTKNRVLAALTNRFAVHVVMALIVATASVANIRTGTVRAESFGEDTLLYDMVSQDLGGSTEEVVAGASVVTAHPSSYDDRFALLPEGDVDFHGEDTDYVTTTVGGFALVSPTISQGSASVAPRTESESYVVQNGDTIWGIADRYNLSLSTILWANNLTVRSTIRPGQALSIPPVDGVLYTIKKGDTVAQVAKRYKADAEKILAFNRIGDGSSLTVGQKLMIPGGEPPAPPAPVRRTIGSVIAGPRGSSQGRGSWRWPTDWRVITQYYGWRHTGVDIDGDYGTNNYAAADGVVVYSGWRNGYGLTVEVDHGNGVKTRYAHHSKLLVSVGEAVSTGQILGKTGTTGRSTGTHLHFEVIVNGRFANPLEYVR